MSQIHFNPLSYPVLVQVKDSKITLWQPDLNLHHSIGHITALPKNDQIGEDLVNFMNKVISQVKIAQAKNMVLSRPSDTKLFHSLRFESVSIKEAAEYLGLSKSTIQRACGRGILETIRTPGGPTRVGHRLVSVESLKRYRERIDEARKKNK